MKQRPRIYYTETDKSLMWDRWQKGESLNSIARLFGRHHSAIQGILARTGGIRPVEMNKGPPFRQPFSDDRFSNAPAEARRPEQITSTVHQRRILWRCLLSA